jgi:hypothetical protein
MKLDDSLSLFEFQMMFLVLVYVIIYLLIKKNLSRELISIGRTLHYISRGPGCEPWSSHLSTLRVQFLATKLLDKKKVRHHIFNQNLKLLSLPILRLICFSTLILPFRVRVNSLLTYHIVMSLKGYILC